MSDCLELAAAVGMVAFRGNDRETADLALISCYPWRWDFRNFWAGRRDPLPPGHRGNNVRCMGLRGLRRPTAPALPGPRGDLATCGLSIGSFLG